MCYPERRGLVSLCGVKAACSGDLCAGNGHRGKNWSLDILSRAFFNGPELTSRISRFAPDQLTQATGESKLHSLAKEGWKRHQVNGPVPLTGADGVVRSTSNNWWLERTTPSAPAKELRRFFLMGAATPLCQGGEFLLQKPAQMSKLQTRAKARDYMLSRNVVNSSISGGSFAAFSGTQRAGW